MSDEPLRNSVLGNFGFHLDQYRILRDGYCQLRFRGFGTCICILATRNYYILKVTGKLSFDMIYTASVSLDEDIFIVLVKEHYDLI